MYNRARTRLYYYPNPVPPVQCKGCLLSEKFYTLLTCALTWYWIEYCSLRSYQQNSSFRGYLQMELTMHTNDGLTINVPFPGYIYL
ncbi:Uncharacterized protein BM_BM189 [Brugia malayi]|uniref:Bm189 n=1 Tax=Brugia malayi TaxID=6279 RepID=A0A0K0J3I9_BRUMA|nr:Uncharacterized protein BM_BM189 [Brugia malayi]CDP91605.1 Bm189 [Brugia malayi]VIO88040.1 Uncharacterized protein BM_BM189 [Brugia malayi]